MPEGSQEGLKYEVKGLVVQGGGPASNGVCVASQLGFKTGFLTKLGNNTWSEISRMDFKRYHVEVDLVPQTSRAQPAVSMIQVNPKSGERTIFYSLENYSEMTPEEVPVELIQRTKVILVDGYHPQAALKVLEIAKSSGIRSVIDIESTDAMTARQFIERATDTVLPFATAKHLSGEEDPKKMLRFFRNWGSERIVITDGARGSWGMENEDEVIHQSSFPVSVVDTTGCGDSYHGAYATGFLWDLSFAQRIEFASWIAGRVAMAVGGRTNLPDLNQLFESHSFPLNKVILEKIKKKIKS